MKRPVLIGALVTSVVALVASGAAAVGLMNGAATPRGSVSPTGASRAAPKLPGTVVHISLTDMGGPAHMGGPNQLGGPMMGQRTTMMSRGGMRLTADRDTVRRGSISFLVTNNGSIKHEMVILPLSDAHAAGTRPIQAGAKIDEAGSLGEASATNGEGAGKGISPTASSWVTVTLPPGHYELVCNLARHYTAGMYAQLTVTP